jgi:hypothetical protein
MVLQVLLVMTVPMAALVPTRPFSARLSPTGQFSVNLHVTKISSLLTFVPHK